MPDTQQAVIEDEGKQPVELPTTENPTEEVAPQSEEARSAEPEGELPEEVKERTRIEFEKLKAKNHELAEKLSKFEAPQQQRRSVFDVYAPKEYQTPQVQPDQAGQEFSDITPDEDGYINVDLLNKTNRAIAARIQKLEEEARVARQKAEQAESRVAKYEHTDKSQKVYREFPYLDPTTDQFNQKFSDLVRKELLDQMVNEGREDYLEAAKKVKAEYYDPTPQVQEVKEEPQPQPVQSDKKIVQREQINAIQGGGSAKAPVDQEYLVEATRRGSKEALYERLKKSGY